jgi:hypothetical protein
MEMPGMETRHMKSRVPPRPGYVRPNTKKAARTAKKGAATKGDSTGSAKRKREAKVLMNTSADSGVEGANPEHESKAQPSAAAHNDVDEDFAKDLGFS